MKKNALSRIFGRHWRAPMRRLRLDVATRLSMLFGRIPDCGNGFESHGVLVSVLIPSRGRIKMLQETLANVAQTCGENHAQVEVLVRLDDDDAESLAATDSFHLACAPVKLTIVVGPRGGGYETLHLFVNELAAAARGDFLLLFNDDARFVSRDWSLHIARWRNRLVVLRFDTGDEMMNLFPAAHRKIFEILGHFSLDAHCDSWIEDVALAVDAQRHEAAVKISHLRDESEEARDQMFIETSAAYARTQPIFRSKKKLRVVDARRLRAHIIRHGRFCG